MVLSGSVSQDRRCQSHYCNPKDESSQFIQADVASRFHPCMAPTQSIHIFAVVLSVAGIRWKSDDHGTREGVGFLCDGSEQVVAQGWHLAVRSGL